jgi:hypothetical protein
MTKGLKFDSQLGQEFSLLPIIHTGSKVHPTSDAFSPELKQPGHYADHSPPTSAGVKKS